MAESKNVKKQASAGIDPALKSMLTDPIHLMSLGFGSGLSPKAPGTVGTLAALPVVALMHLMPLSWYIGFTLLAILFGVYACEKTAEELGVHDHPAIVWDEFSGIMVTCIALPLGLVWIILAFVLFRFFDILKPWPISAIDRHTKGGLGIMLDDIIAGLFSLAILQAIYGLTVLLGS